MTRLRCCCAAVALLASVAGCGIVLSKDLEGLSKPATTLTGAGHVVSDYNRVREQVDIEVAPSALVDIEGGALLEIDQGLLFLRRELALTASPVRLSAPRDVLVGRFDRYPLWFVAVTSLSKQDEQVIAVFVRSTSTSAWLMTEAPRLAGSTALPSVATDEDGAVVRYDDARARWSDGESTGLAVAPQKLVDRYASVLQKPDSRYRDDFVADSFISQMRTTTAAQPRDDASFSQSWRAQRVKHVLRLSDGGALVFATLSRTDRYRVERGRYLDFTGLEAGAYLSSPVKNEATLTYQHQVLMVVPGQGKPLVIGQYGGLIDATGS